MGVDDRSQLTSRVIPKMTFSDGSPSSLTAPPPPFPATMTPAERAAARFAVRGNAIVTGGAGDLGSKACRALLEHGLQGLVIFDLKAEQAAPTIKKLREEFPSATIEFVQVDVTSEEAVSAGVNRAVVLLGSVEILLCFAGIASSIDALETTPAEFKTIFDINATGAFLCAQAVAQVMVAQGEGGSITLIGSVSAHGVNYPQPQFAYNSAKAAVLAMRKSFAAEWATYGIRVNSISPGYMNTILNEGEGLEEFRQSWYSRNPMGRMGEPEELTGVVVLLSSRAGSYITGSDFIVDGGQLLIF